MNRSRSLYSSFAVGDRLVVNFRPTGLLTHEDWQSVENASRDVDDVPRTQDALPNVITAESGARRRVVGAVPGHPKAVVRPEHLRVDPELSSHRFDRSDVAPLVVGRSPWVANSAVTDNRAAV